MIDIKEEPKIYNAKVKFSFLGMNETATTINTNSVIGLCLQIGFDCEIGSITTKRIAIRDTTLIYSILSALDLKSWEELPRKFARIKVADRNVVAIGNLIENNWVSL